MNRLADSWNTSADLPDACRDITNLDIGVIAAAGVRRRSLRPGLPPTAKRGFRSLTADEGYFAMEVVRGLQGVRKTRTGGLVLRLVLGGMRGVKR